MGKKLPIFISTLIAASGSFCLQTPLVSATQVITDSGYRAWSLEEMNDFYYRFEADRDAICGSNSECRNELIFQFAEADTKYHALEAYSMMPFIISAINPEESTIRAFYRDIDQMALEMEGILLHNLLNEAYIAWTDNSYAGQSYNFIEQMRNNQHPDGLHEIYKATTELNGGNWFPVETEVEIAAPEAHLKLNANGAIMSFARGGDMSVLAHVNYSECLNSPSYEPGAECQIVFTETGNYTYVPVLLAAPDEPTDEPEPINEPGNGPNGDQTSGPSDDSVDDLTDNELGDTPTTGQGIELNNPTSSPEPTTEDAPTATLTDDDTNSTTANNQTVDKSTLAEATTTILTSGTNTKTIKTPETGANTIERHENNNHNGTFSWWLGLIFALGGATLIWLFLPNHCKNHKK